VTWSQDPDFKAYQAAENVAGNLRRNLIQRIEALERRVSELKDELDQRDRP
jgi:uncharacterized protein YceH (UPF0502 family)